VFIRRLSLHNFRNYESQNLSFSEGLNILYGDNAQGKTNVLEAIYLGCTGRSFRTRDEREMIRMDSPYYRILCESGEKSRSISVQITALNGKKKEIRMNGQPIRSYSELIGKVHIVTFTPEDLKLVKEGPQERRRFLDRELSLISSSYNYHFNQYQKALKHRNHLLKEKRMSSDLDAQLDPWDQQLSQHGCQIILKRSSFVKEIMNYAGQIHSKISSDSEKLKIIYQMNPKNMNLSNYDTMVKELYHMFKDNARTDALRGMTTAGPHRDDLFFEINDKSVQDFGSQGQVRSTALSLKLSEVEVIRNIMDLKPVVLLDDVLSELDVKRQNSLLKALGELQVFMTVTDLEGLETSLIQRASLYEVRNGTVEYQGIV